MRKVSPRIGLQILLSLSRDAEESGPDDERITNVQFKSEGMDSDASVLTLENSRIRGLALNLPVFAVGQPVPIVSVEGLPASIRGVWGLFEIRLQAGLKANSQYIRIPMSRKRYLSIFISNEGKLFLPTARHIWDSMQATDPKIYGMVELDESIELFNALHQKLKKWAMCYLKTLKVIMTHQFCGKKTVVPLHLPQGEKQ